MQQQIVINNQLISFFQQGPKEAKQTLVFLHGWRSNKEVWTEIIEKLSIINPQLAVISLDLPGFGNSPRPKSDWGVGEYASLVSELIKKLELKNVIVVGHSFGGRISIKLVSQYPLVVSKLVLVDAAGFVMGQKRKYFFQLVAKIVKPIFKPKFMHSARRKIYKIIGAEDYVATPEMQKIYLNTTNEDLTEDMKRINIPTLIVFGEKDNITPVEFGVRMHKKIRNSKFEILKSAGHFSFLDKGEEFVKILKDFLGWTIRANCPVEKYVH